jgi:hypothetical protein
VLLEIAGMLSLAGFFTWILGAVFEYPEIATIGGATIVAVGAMITGTGLEYRTGEAIDQNRTYESKIVELAGQDSVVVTNQTNSTKSVVYETESVAFPTRFPAGVLLMLIGGLLTTRTLGEEGGIM